MKPIFLTISGIAALTVSSCVNPPSTASTGQNRFGYNGTTSTNTQPTAAVQQDVVTDPVTPNRFGGEPPMATTSTQNSGSDTIALDTLPTNNPQPTSTSSDTTANTSATNSSNVASNDTTAPTTPENTAEEKPKKPEYLYGIPVPGRDGMVYSPYNKDAGYIDVRHMKPGALAEDPYTPGKLFRVP